MVFGGHTEQVWPGGWSPNGQRVVTASNDDTVRIWNANTAEELLTIHIPVGYGIQAKWSPDGEHVAVGANMSLITVWRVWQTTDELLEFAQECCAIRELTPAERIQFGLR